MTRAIVITIPARAYTLHHPDGRLVAEVLWGDFGRPVLVVTKPSEVGTDWRFAVVPSWHKACDEARSWARDEWRLDVPEPDDATPADPTADIIAGLEAERDRLRALVEDLGARLLNVLPPLPPGAVQAARMLERERIVAWLKSDGPGEDWDLGDAIERGEHEEGEGNG